MEENIGAKNINNTFCCNCDDLKLIKLVLYPYTVMTCLMKCKRAPLSQSKLKLNFKNESPNESPV